MSLEQPFRNCEHYAIPSTPNSYAFLSANRVQAVVDLQKAGYVEEEYIVSGTANVYEWAADGSVKVKTPNAPYTTRILIRRPAIATRFSGNVILEPLQNNRAWDWAFMWGTSYEYFIEHGEHGSA
jgi:Alpha/beta hydrolase domain